MIEALLILSIFGNIIAGLLIALMIVVRRTGERIVRLRLTHVEKANAQLEKEKTALKVMHLAALRQIRARDEIDVLDAEEIG